MKAVLKQLSSLILPVTVLVIIPLLIESNLTITLGVLSITGLILVSSGLAIIVIVSSPQNLAIINLGIHVFGKAA